MSPDTRRPSPTSLALSIVGNVEEGAEMTPAEGDRAAEPVDELGVVVKPGVRSFGNESNYRYGIKEGFPRIARLLDEYHVRATWTTAAVALEKAPHIADFIRTRGDEAASHGNRWIHQFRMDEDAEREFLRSARTSIARTVGTAPSGHLSRYLLTERTRELLVQEGYTYHMDDYSGDEPFWDVTPSGPIVIVPYAIDTNDMKMWTDPAYTPRDWCTYMIDTFDQLYAERREGHRMMSVGLHLRIAGRPGRIGAFRRFIEHVQSHDDVWWAHRREIAAAFAADVPPPD